jgi:hypothetical protein
MLILSSIQFWKSTLDSFRCQDGQDSYSKIVLTRSVDTLADRIQDLTAGTKNSRAREALRLMSPLVGQLNSVSGIANKIALTSPEVGAMIWGSVALIVTVSLASP